MELQTSNKAGCLKTQIGFSIGGRQIKKRFQCNFKSKTFADEKWIFICSQTTEDDDFFIKNSRNYHFLREIEFKLVGRKNGLL